MGFASGADSKHREASMIVGNSPVLDPAFETGRPLGMHELHKANMPYRYRNDPSEICRPYYPDIPSRLSLPPSLISALPEADNDEIAIHAAEPKVPPSQNSPDPKINDQTANYIKYGPPRRIKRHPRRRTGEIRRISRGEHKENRVHSLEDLKDRVEKIESGLVELKRFRNEFKNLLDIILSWVARIYWVFS